MLAVDGAQTSRLWLTFPEVLLKIQRPFLLASGASVPGRVSDELEAKVTASGFGMIRTGTCMGQASSCTTP